MKSINIMGHRVRIVVEKDKDNWGSFDGDKKVIYVQAGLTKKQREETIKHECMHAVLFFSGIHFTLNDHDMEEALIRCLEYNYLPLLNKIEKEVKDDRKSKKA